MELFKRRYLCILSFVFIFVSVAVLQAGDILKLTLIALFLLLAIVALVVCVLNRKIRFAAVVCLLSCLLAAVAALNSFAFITLPVQKALSFQGRYTAELEIISLEYRSEHSSEYNARLLQADGEAVNIKTYLVCDFESDFSYGDRIIAIVDSEAVDIGNNNRIDKDILLYLSVDSSQPVMYSEQKAYDIFSFDWLRAQTKSLRSSLCEYVYEIFGEHGALVKGMLINEKSDISSFTKAQFRRAGVSHILAVSGLHVSLLLGVFEILLRKFFVPKKIRIAVIVASGTLLLAMTDFSASSVRAVLMLFAVYLNYMISEESDAPTSLFVAVALIILFSPFSVIDIGMWLSFAATLGLVTVYAYLQMRLRQVGKNIEKHKRLAAMGIKLLNALLITTVANMFILPLMWYFFGNFSLASLPCNLLISPLSAAFLPLCVLSLIFGRLSLVGDAIVFVTKGIGSLILHTVGVFADLRLATVSLKYPFAAILVALFALSMAILMVIRLKRKMLICIPTVAFVSGFAVCWCIFAAVSSTSLRYAANESDEILVVERAGVVSVCDMTDGRAESSKLIFDNLPEYSVEIENYVITSIRRGHISSLERIYQSSVIRRLYIPLSTDKEKIEYSDALYKISQKYNTEVIFYHNGTELRLFDDLLMKPFFRTRENDYDSVFLSFYNSEIILTYSDASQVEAAFAIGAQSKYFLLGSHGSASENDHIRRYDMSGTELIASNKDIAEGLSGFLVYVPRSESQKRNFEITVE